MSHKSTELRLLIDVRADTSRELALNTPKDLRGETASNFADLFEEHAAFVWRVAARLGVGEADLPDVCQDVFIAVHRMLPGFQNRCSVKTWLYSICLRTVSRHRRRAFRRRESIPAIFPEDSTEPQQADYVELREFRRQLDDVLDKLPQEQSELFMLYEFEELSVPQAAAIVGCPVQTAYSRLHAAREAVVAAFTRKGGR